MEEWMDDGWMDELDGQSRWMDGRMDGLNRWMDWMD